MTNQNRKRGIIVLALLASAILVTLPASASTPRVGSKRERALLGAYGLSDVWGSSSNDVFAVGESGTILHYDGNSWNVMSSGTTDDLYGVWGSSWDDVFAVGESGTILHYDGVSWSEMARDSTGWLAEVWGSSGSDVFAVGDEGTILHYDGVSWSAMNSGTTDGLSGVWGGGRYDVFAVGDPGTILHYDGTSWTAMSSGTAFSLHDVWGSSGRDVFAVGWLGTILHCDGTNWSPMESGRHHPWDNITGVWGSSGDDVFAVGYDDLLLHYDGTSWSSMNYTTPGLHAVWGSSGSDVYAVGEAGAILHYDGTEWQPSTVETPYSISGRVTDTSGKPIAGVAVSAGGGASSATDANGEYTISNLLPGKYTVSPGPGWFWSPHEPEVVAPPDASGQDFTGCHILKLVYLEDTASGDAAQYGDELFYAILLTYPETTTLQFRDPVPTYTVYIEDSLVAFTGVVAYDHNANAISGTLNVGPKGSTLVAFDVQVGITGTIGFAPVIVNEACAYTADGDLLECAEARSYTYLWPVYLPVAVSQ
jgi:hypothetical protein